MPVPQIFDIDLSECFCLLTVFWNKSLGRFILYQVADDIWNVKSACYALYIYGRNNDRTK
jgi:hypothetical protein